MATLWIIVGTVAALASAAVAAVYTWLTHKLVRSQSEPNVVIYVRHDESRATFIQIVVENIGRSVARDIKFSFSRSVPNRAFGLSEVDAPEASKMTDGPLIEGIPALGPGDSRKIVWGQYGGLRKALGDEVIGVSYTYRHGDREMPESFGVLDIRSFKGTDAVDNEGARVIRELKRIADVLEKSQANRIVG